MLVPGHRSPWYGCYHDFNDDWSDSWTTGKPKNIPRFDLFLWLTTSIAVVKLHPISGYSWIISSPSSQLFRITQLSSFLVPQKWGVPPKIIRFFIDGFSLRNQPAIGKSPWRKPLKIFGHTVVFFPTSPISAPRCCDREIPTFSADSAWSESLGIIGGCSPPVRCLPEVEVGVYTSFPEMEVPLKMLGVFVVGKISEIFQWRMILWVPPYFHGNLHTDKVVPHS